MNLNKKLDELRGRATSIADLTGTMSLLSWDQETMMPPGGAESRAHQLGTLASLVHRFYTDPSLGDLLNELSDALSEHPYDSTEASVVRTMLRQYRLRTRIPSELVVKRTELSARAREVWKRARRNDDFAVFVPFLEEQFALAREVAEALGYEKNPYDALLDSFEPGTSYEWISTHFQTVRRPLIDLAGRIAEAVRNDPNHSEAASLTHRHVDKATQLAYSRRIAKAVGFDWEHGRIDLSAHPFTSGSSYLDVRITTRIDEEYFPSCLFAVIHESGHGIHGQNLDPELYRIPVRYGLAIAESQSRFYENMIGRSLGFWEHHYRGLQESVPQFADVSLDQWYRAINAVAPSLIRVEADEVTYGLHIMLRFELENAVIAGEVKPGDLAGEWKQRMEEYLGVRPPNDADGVLQDIHWSQGGIGYFPDYLLGSMLSAQLWDALVTDQPSLPDAIAGGSLSEANRWMAERVQRHGGKFTLAEIAERATGSSFSGEAYLNYLTRKYSPIYGV
jgi:carboxypeptidase Taq